MKRTLLISATILTFACGHDAQQSSRTGTASAAAQPGTAATTPPGMRTPVNERVAVTLVGCLQDTQEPGAAATTGSAAGERARARANGGVPDSQTHGRAATAQYTLVDATVESGGVGANGAGGSGGPLLSPGSSVELDGVPADAQASLNQKVRITGQITAVPTATAATAALNGQPAPANSATSSSGAGAPSGMGATGAPGSPAATSGSISAEPRQSAAAGANGTTGRRHVTVEKIETTGQSCNNSR